MARVPGDAAGASVTVKPDLVRIENVTKRFGLVTALQQVSLTVRRGEVFGILGSSGCGKSTLLRLIAGLEPITEGRIQVNGLDVGTTPPERLPVNMMFQSYALFPHMNVQDNVAYGLRREGVRGRRLRERVAEALSLVEMDAYWGRRPHQLSGGQSQRVALARCIVKRPQLLLLDEPLASLDKRLREATQQALLRVQRELGLTYVLVTHDQEEALSMAHRIAVMDQGTVQQVGPPRVVYQRPANLFVAQFLGSINRLKAEVRERSGDTLTVVLEAGGLLTVPAQGDFAPGEPVFATIRPEHLRLVPVTTAEAPRGGFPATVSSVGFTGHATLYRVDLGGHVELQALLRDDPAEDCGTFQPGNRVHVVWPAEHTQLFRP